MASLEDVVIYIARGYPEKRALSPRKLTAIVYLADWRSAITRGKLLTGIRWMFVRHFQRVRNFGNCSRLLTQASTFRTGEPCLAVGSNSLLQNRTPVVPYWHLKNGAYLIS